MGDPFGFLNFKREDASYLPVSERIKNFKEFIVYLTDEKLKQQGARCMDCGVPFCNWGCPIGNYIPEWNDLVYKGFWEEAAASLLETNNFPEFTGVVCPAPCETACVLGINEPAVAIKQNEISIINKAFKEGWIVPQPPPFRTGKRVAVIGSGPSGLAAADQLNHMGHTVTVYERDKSPGGLLRYGIPDFKLNKDIVQRRINIMEQEGVLFKTGICIGKDLPAKELLKEFNVVCLSGGSTEPRDLKIQGRELEGIYFAMQFLKEQNQIIANEKSEYAVNAKNKDVIIIGGGDTGSDCVGTSIRQGAKSVTQIEILPEPPIERPDDTPWPNWPRILRTSSSHQEGCRRLWSVMTKSFEGVSKVERLNCVKVEWNKDRKGSFIPKEIDGSEFTLKADLVLLAMGFTGPEKKGLIKELGVAMDERGNVATDINMATSVPKVFSAGDMRRGQSLVVWAIAEGRKAAEEINNYLLKSL